MRHAVLTLALGIAAPVLAWAQAAPPVQAPVSGNPETGRTRFKEYVCYYCHGTEGQGSSPSIGPRIAGTPRSLDSFMRYVHRPGGRMSAYAETVIPEPVLVDIYAFLRSMPPPKKAADVPLLEQLRKK